MFPNKNHLITSGDALYEEDLAQDTTADLQLRCETLDEVVTDNIVPLPKALKAYNVTPEQYFGYLIMQGRKEKVEVTKALFVAGLQALIGLLSTTHLDAKAKKVVEDIRELDSVGS